MSRKFFVLLSSIEHLNKLTEIAKTPSSWEKFMGYYTARAGFPYVYNLFNAPARLPLTYFSDGTLEIKEQSISFTPYNFAVFGQFFHFMKNSPFEIKKDNIISIEKYQSEKIERYPGSWSRILRYKSKDWVRVKTSENILGGDFLISSRVSPPRLRRIPNTFEVSTAELYDELIKWAL